MARSSSLMLQEPSRLSARPTTALEAPSMCTRRRLLRSPLVGAAAAGVLGTVSASPMQLAHAADADLAALVATVEEARGQLKAVPVLIKVPFIKLPSDLSTYLSRQIVAGIASIKSIKISCLWRACLGRKVGRGSGYLNNASALRLLGQERESTPAGNDELAQPCEP